MATKALRESDELPWFKLYVREWLTRLLGASLAAQGALMRLLCVSWDQRSLPIDPDACRRLAGADEREWRRIWPEIREHLEELDGALVSPPLEILRTEAIGDRSSRRLGAKKTNEKRWKTASLSESLSESLSDTLSDTLSGSPSASLNGRYLRVQSSDSDSPLRGAPVRRRRDPAARQRVFEHWRKAWNHPGATLDAKRSRVIDAALQAYSEADLCRSIDGYLQSPHHCGENDRRTRYDAIGLFLRDAEHIEAGLQFADGAAAGKPSPAPISDEMRGKIAGWVERKRIQGKYRAACDLLSSFPTELKVPGWHECMEQCWANPGRTLQ